MPIISQNWDGVTPSAAPTGWTFSTNMQTAASADATSSPQCGDG
jgi:hypothetical protein